jgi:hypothetical protein
MEYTTFLAHERLLAAAPNILKTYEYVDNKSFLNVIGFHFIVGRRAVAY